MQDRDSAADIRLGFVSGWGTLLGYAVGGLAGWALGARYGWPLLPAVVVGAIMGRLAITGSLLLLIEAAGRLGGLVYAPSGASTPARAQYSRAAALAARGRLDEALTAYLAHVADHPADPVPYLRLARLFREQMGDPAEAIRWFRAARDAEGADEDVARLATREIIETFTNRLGETGRAVPELARLTERFPESPDGRWAAARLRELKAELGTDTSRKRV